MNESKPNGETATAVATATPASEPPREKLTKKEIAADHPTWCPGCGDFSVLALYFKLIEKRKIGTRRSPPSPASAAPAAFRISSRATARITSTAARCRFASGISPRAARSARVRVRRRRRRVLHRRQSFQPHRAQEHQDDLRRHGQLGLRPDEEADLAHVAARFQEQDRPTGRGGLSDQPDETGDLGRRNVRRAHARHEPESRVANDGSARWTTTVSASSNA